MEGIERPRLAPGGVSRAAHPGETTRMELAMTQLHTDALEIIAENATLELGRANNYVAQHIEAMVKRARLSGMETQLAIRDATMTSMRDAIATGGTRKEASKQFLSELRKRGITSFIDAKGSNWNMSTYAEMVGRTTAREAVMQGTFGRVREHGGDLVEIPVHPGACDKCIPWEGRILSLTGETDGYATVGEAEADGLWHPQCSHSPIPYFEDDEDSEHAA